MPRLQEPEAILANPWRALLRDAATGHRVHAVGGAVRDAFLGNRRAAPGGDLDVTVDADAESLARLLAERVPARLVELGQKEHAALRLVPTGENAATLGEIDFWDRRGGSLLADLERRDLTVHAVAIDLRDGTVEDPLGGLDDLARGILRDTTERSLAEDPQRAVRLARFAAQLPDFSVDPGTLQRAARAADHLDRIAAERIRTELARWTWQPNFRLGAHVLARYRPFAGIGSSLGALTHLEALIRAESPGGEREQEVAVWLILAARAPEAFAAWIAKGWVERGIERDVARRRRLPAAPDTAPDRREWLHRAGLGWRPWLWADLSLGHASPEAARRTLAAFGELARDEALFSERGAIDGQDLRDLGIPPGPRLGEILAELRRREVRGEWSDRAAALEWAARRWRSPTSGS
jgi:tRNA nucleotidyltransferase/poly(A) polymerase